MREGGEEAPGLTWAEAWPPPWQGLGASDVESAGLGEWLIAEVR